jgi:hypothetical protein
MNFARGGAILVLAPRGDTYTETIMSGHGQNGEQHCQNVRVGAAGLAARSAVLLCGIAKPTMQEVGSTT